MYKQLGVYSGILGGGEGRGGPLSSKSCENVIGYIRLYIFDRIACFYLTGEGNRCLESHSLKKGSHLMADRLYFENKRLRMKPNDEQIYPSFFCHIPSWMRT